MNSISKVAAAIAIAATAGIVLGILFAPDKGTETRKKITRKGNDIADDLKDAFSKEKDKFNGLKENISKTLKNKVEEFA